MKILIAKQDLMDAIKLTSTTISTTGSDISTHYLFRVTGDGTGAEVLSQSNRVFSSCPLVCQVVGHTDGEPSAFTVEGKRLQMWLSAVEESALTLEFDGEVVKATAPVGDQQFGSLDPEMFPLWDDVLKEATSTVSLDTPRLFGALSHLRSFISTDDTKTPEFSLTEVREGLFYASDKETATVVGVQGIDGSAVRIHGKNIPALQQFLTLCGDGTIEILEHDRFAIYRRGDGALFGESRFSKAFPMLDVGRDREDQHYWILSKEGVETGIRFLRSGAPHEDVRLFFRPSEVGVEMGMTRMVGGQKFLPVECVESGASDNSDDLDSFAISYKNLEKILSSYTGDTIRFGINQKGKGGWVRFDESRAGDDYLSIVAWEV